MEFPSQFCLDPKWNYMMKLHDEITNCIICCIKFKFLVFCSQMTAKSKKNTKKCKINAPAGNRTRVASVAGMHDTSTPPALDVRNAGLLQLMMCSQCFSCCNFWCNCCNFKHFHGTSFSCPCIDPLASSPVEWFQEWSSMIVIIWKLFFFFFFNFNVKSKL